jgi:S-(hydroxymethyl)glutathione dehydrogenase/alcohol dehydrogenase
MGTMKTRAAVIRAPGKWWEITELDLDEPKDHEVLVKMKASGLCHSDEHIREGAPHIRYPLVGGHEGAGIVEAVGNGVTRVKVGDHVVTSYIPVCGHCRYCSTGHQNLCDAGKNAAIGCLEDGTFRFHEHGEDLGGMCVLGTFSERAVLSENSCVAIDGDLPFEVACLVGCGVTTGWASSVYAAATRAGDTVVVIGIGGVGINAVQGARFAGAKNVIAIDLVPFKLEKALELGATFATSDPEEARQHIVEVTRGQMADHAVITVGVMESEVMKLAVSLIGKASDVIVTAVGRPNDMTIQLTGSPLTGWQKRIQGALFGGANPLYDIPKILGLYRSGDMKLDELITRRYSLDQVNEGYQDMLDGKNIRGVMIFDD